MAKYYFAKVLTKVWRYMKLDSENCSIIRLKLQFLSI